MLISVRRIALDARGSEAQLWPLLLMMLLRRLVDSRLLLEVVFSTVANDHIVFSEKVFKAHVLQFELFFQSHRSLEQSRPETEVGIVRLLLLLQLMMMRLRRWIHLMLRVMVMLLRRLLLPFIHIEIGWRIRAGARRRSHVVSSAVDQILNDIRAKSVSLSSSTSSSRLLLFRRIFVERLLFDLRFDLLIVVKRRRRWQRLESRRRAADEALEGFTVQGLRRRGCHCR